MVSLATTGMVGMGADLMILLLYQTYRGTLYLEVGLIIALFMLGLALGAYHAGRVRRYGRRRGAVALSDLFWVVFLLGLIPLCSRLSAAPAEAGLLLSIAALVAGALTALPFPWVVARISEAHAACRPKPPSRPTSTSCGRESTPDGPISPTTPWTTPGGSTRKRSVGW